MFIDPMNKLLLSITLIMLHGCSSIAGRVGDDSLLGTPYSGFEYSVENAKNCNLAALLGFPPAIVVTVPISIVDMIGSLALDTVIVPIDLLVENENDYKKSLCHIDFST
jgi:uncharacterized protein YceK